MSEHSSQSKTSQLQKVIYEFIKARRDDKLKGDIDPKKIAKYDYATWLADAARRVSQIQSVTHVLKASHPDARGSSLHVRPAQLYSYDEIGSHLLGEQFTDDIVGNAAALDVYKFLKVEVAGKRLMDWFRENDPDLKAALSQDPDQAEEWTTAFNSLIRNEQHYASHSRAKQVYWCISDEPCDDIGYHLLQPMFPSSLVHAVHADIQDARFGEANKEARQARRNGSESERVYRSYQGLLTRKLGGTKPQNISQLNSERGGVNYLLSSLPPTWTSQRKIRVFDCDSVFTAFTYWGSNKEALNGLIAFLQSDPPDNKHTRDTRHHFECVLAESLAAYGAEIRSQYEPGWTAQQNCRLPECEQLWLDPERNNEAFQARLTFGDWPDEIATRFALWMNEQLRKAKLPVGDSEAKHWARQAVIDAAWPIPMQRRYKQEVVHE